MSNKQSEKFIDMLVADILKPPPTTKPPPMRQVHGSGDGVVTFVIAAFFGAFFFLAGWVARGG